MKRPSRAGQFVDTSGWVALFDADDSNHVAAATHWSQLRRSRLSLYTTDYVLDESITLARRRAGYAVALALGQALLSSQLLHLIEVTAPVRRDAWRLFQKYDDKVLSFTDCTSFAVMAQLGLHEAFTFDDDFAQVGYVCRP
jgi:predicted nucleic acid-binding protein